MSARRTKTASLSLAGAGALAFTVAALAASACGGDDPPPEQVAGEGGRDLDAASSKTFDVPPPRVIGPAVECATGSAIEEEPNDTAQTANVFTELSYCGVLEKATDVDFVSFTTPAGTKLGVFQAVIDGQVELVLTLGGATFGPGDTDKFGSGTYVVKVFTKAGKPAAYQIRVQYDPT